MTKIWVLTANSGNATLFTADSPTAALTELMNFDNPHARAKQMELSSDRAGRSFDSHGEGRHAMAVEVEPKEQEQIRFAKLIADRLEQGRVENAFERLVVVAAPAFLGLLRANFNTPLSSLLSLEIDKDYTALRPEELRTRLPERL
ncbi:Protein required for attachment to host cells [Nitrosomonas cryotolerans]|uniref:Protein required for attachment to host cells n=1 Tax=Nitrosomonas cryotolerans ATCC 49181 TaxID=1131553 RepID=A0A1N6JKA4_9PROT|nr:host attachment protein [Nitrosomonas cryotolerans]SFQ00298.1 Protein required for attachment to host cells [Nitrosomonas cryotolerans]SIO44710.1 Protein required for attachment to host cells [Nitrosomonas cryotolerans ATCC 49181]